MPNPIERPKPKKPQPPAPRTTGDQTTSKQTPPKKVISRPLTGHGGGSKDGGGRPPGGGGNNFQKPPSCWLNPDNELSLHKTASFVEYLRWMREPLRQLNDKGKDPTDPTTKAQILQKAMESAKNYDPRLKRCVERTRKMASVCFEVTAPWRIRVGGHRGPESILLPAFDSLGMPYIPSASLRGIARTQAIRDVMKNTGKNWQNAEKDPLIVKHFGALDADKGDQAGKVVFFDAYPKSGQCLTMDMANNIWSWQDKTLEYSPNPNPFLSLKEPTFVIGLGLIAGSQDKKLLDQVKQWLIAGLANGAGSQVNTGYGQLLENPKKPLIQPFLKVEFALQGQLIHGYQKPGRWNAEKNRFDNGTNQAEVRPIAFKSMLRYWFRVFAFGIMSPDDVKTLEAKIFGSLESQSIGLIKIDVLAQEPEEKNEQSGILRLFYTAQVNECDKNILHDLFSSLTWLMFYLGGVGQGARRPYYERNSYPKIRGTSFFVIQPDEFSKIPSDPHVFTKLMSKKIQRLLDVLELFKQRYNLNGEIVIPQVSKHTWSEWADKTFRIVVVPNTREELHKSYALSQLNDRFHQLDNQAYSLKNEKKYNEYKQKYSELKSLCGGVELDKVLINEKEQERKVTPSPIWIRSLGPFDVVTIFGANASPRKDYLAALQNKIQVFPLT